jgi:hypothetical protein
MAAQHAMKDGAVKRVNDHIKIQIPAVRPGQSAGDGWRVFELRQDLPGLADAGPAAQGAHLP